MDIPQHINDIEDATEWADDNFKRDPRWQDVEISCNLISDWGEPNE